MRSRRLTVSTTLAVVLSGFLVASGVLSSGIASAAPATVKPAAVESVTIKAVPGTHTIVLGGKKLRITISRTGEVAVKGAANATPGASARPDIQPGNCASSPKWVHVWPGPVCYGFAGPANPDIPVNDICFGNNYGVAGVAYPAGNSITYYNVTEGEWLPSAGSEWASGHYLDYLDIGGWRGGDSCP